MKDLSSKCFVIIAILAIASYCRASKERRTSLKNEATLKEGLPLLDELLKEKCDGSSNDLECAEKLLDEKSASISCLSCIDLFIDGPLEKTMKILIKLRDKGDCSDKDYNLVRDLHFITGIQSGLGLSKLLSDKVLRAHAKSCALKHEKKLDSKLNINDKQSIEGDDKIIDREFIKEFVKIKFGTKDVNINRLIALRSWELNFDLLLRDSPKSQAPLIQSKLPKSEPVSQQKEFLYKHLVEPCKKYVSKMSKVFYDASGIDFQYGSPLFPLGTELSSYAYHFAVYEICKNLEAFNTNSFLGAMTS